MNSNRLIMTVLACAALVCSCGKEVIPSAPPRVTFSVLVEDYASAPGQSAVTRSADGPAGGPGLRVAALPAPAPAGGLGPGALIPSSFSVLGYTVGDTWYGTEMPDVFFDRRFTLSGPVWDTGLTLEDDRRVRFYAYAPTGTPNATLASGRTSRGVPVLDVFVPSAPSKQVDILEAVTADCSAGDLYPLDLPFRHALASVGFRFSGLGFACRVEGIELSGVNSRGTTGIATGVWESHGPMTYTAPTSFTVGHGEEAEAPDRFLLIPQRFGPRTRLAVNVTVDGAAYTLSCPLDDIEVRGNTHTEFTVSSSGFVTVTCTPLEEAAGGVATTQTMLVQSYISPAGGSATPAPWVMDFSSDGGRTFSPAPPEWLSVSALSGEGGDSGEAVEVTVAAPALGRRLNSYKTRLTPKDAERSDALKRMKEVGTMSDPVDLSMSDYAGRALRGRTTANCYVVRAPGWYRIPLVYGCAVRDGVPDPGAFGGAGAAFRDASGGLLSVSRPHIVQPGRQDEFSAALGWYCGDGLPSVDVLPRIISDGGCCYAVFHIAAEAISESNFAVSVTGPGQVWSWHIWVTGRDLTPVDTGGGSLLPVPLGYNGPCTKYKHMNVIPPRSCLIRVRAGFGSDPAYAVAGHSAFAMALSTSAQTLAAPYYQWGRKDALAIGGYAIGGTQASCHTNFGHTSNAAGVFEDGGGFLWSRTKTVYDPCPAGLRVPSASLLAGQSPSGSDGEWVTLAPSGLRVPYSGSKNLENGSEDARKIGRYWFADPAEGLRAACLSFGEGGAAFEASATAPREECRFIIPQTDN